MKLSPSITPFDAQADLEVSSRAGPLPRRPSRLGRLIRRYRGFLLIVVLPMLLASGYLLGVAAPQYESETRFLIRSRGGSGTAPSGALGEMLGAAGFRASQEDAMAVREFLQSRDALRGLEGTVDVVAIWRRPEADRLARLWEEDPPMEKLLRYYRRMVTIGYDSSSGALTVATRAFRPEDAQELTEALLRQSENLVNRLSERARGDTLRVAREEVALAEQRVLASREALTNFRVRERAVDPGREAEASQAIVARLENALTEARAEHAEKSAFLRADNPALRNVQNRINALERQIAADRAKMTSDARQALPAQIAGYERLMLERDFADKQLASATASLEQARIESQRQQLFVSRVVQPNLAEYAEYPRVLFLLGSLFAVLCVVYGIGWLLLAGVREHAA
ncbi:capsule biosynthesis protein [Roseomonas sp. OT10]|uniref:capsule biosynthesis protein n=1 Tax=Roseomonas cutis TaxID=2897332 RepID=UPI001E3A1175|nr:capsule biosynthesis protein [Roseomonas sp. OT10]UFN48697.1 capsule biosynthesis protein [Roseomonas sp. OT10]